jgi:hypothetical protein
MSGIEIIALILTNAPAAIRTFGELKTLVLQGFEDVKSSFDDDASVEDARAKVLALMDQIAKTSADIQNID